MKYNGQTIATKNSPNNWQVSHSASTNKAVVAAPETAILGSGYSVEWNLVAIAPGLPGNPTTWSADNYLGNFTVVALNAPVAPSNLNLIAGSSDRLNVNPNVSAFEDVSSIHLGKWMLGVHLNWQDNANNESSYVVQRCRVIPGVGESVWTDFTFPANTTKAIDSNEVFIGANTSSLTTLVPGGTYRYRIKTVNEYASSSWSNVVTVTMPQFPYSVGANNFIWLPVGLSATTVSSSQVDLTWDYPTANPNKYSTLRIYMASSLNGPWTLIKTVTPSVGNQYSGTWSHTGTFSSTRYYRAFACDFTEGPDVINWLPNIVWGSKIIAAYPPDNTDFSLALTPDTAATSYAGGKVKRSVSINPLNGFVATVQLSLANPPPGFSAVFTPNPQAEDGVVPRTAQMTLSIAPGTPQGPYTVTIQGIGVGKTRQKTMAVTVGPPPAVPTAPINLTAAAEDWNQVRLNWTNTSTVSEGVKIERKKEANGTWEQIATVEEGIATYLDKPVVGDTAYEYRVRAYNITGDSPYSNIAYVTTPVDPGATDSNKGVEFWLAFPSNWQSLTAQQKGLSLTIFGPSGTQGTLSGAGISPVQSFTIPATGKLVITVPVTAELTLADSIQNKGIRVTATNQVSIHAVNHAMGGYASGGTEPSSEGYLVLPKSALGTEYIGISLVGDVVNYDITPATLTVLGTEDGSTVSITPSHTVTVLGAKYLKGTTFTLNLDKGETVQLKAYAESSSYFAGLISDNEVQGFTGTIVTANKPIAVFSGSVANTVNVAFPRSAPQYQIEQLIPVNRWGKEFVAHPIYHKATYTSDMGTVAKAEGYIGTYFRVVAAYDGTWIKFNGELAGTLKRGQYLNLPGNHRSGLMQQILQAHIESNLPILVTQHSLKNANGNLAISIENYQPGDDLIYLGLVDFGNLMTLVPAVSQFVTESSSATPPVIVNSVFDYNYINIATTVDGVLGLRLNGLPIDQGLFTTIPDTNLASASIKVGPETQKITTATGVPFSSISYGFTRQGYLQMFPYGHNGFGYPAAINLPAISKPKVNSPPQITITNLVHKGKYISQTALADLPISVSVSDSDGSVSRVEYQVFQSHSGIVPNPNVYVDVIGWKDIIGGASQTITTAPFATTLHFDTTRTGSFVGSSYFTIRATAFDNQDAATTSEIVVQVDSPATNLPPDIRVKSPTFSVVAGTMLVSRRGPPAPTSIPVEVEVSDPNNNLTGVEFKLLQGQTEVKPHITFGANAPFQGTFTDVATGNYTLRILATDSLGAVGQQDILVFVEGAGVNSASRRINAGGPNYTPIASVPAPTAGGIWQADNSFYGGITSLFSSLNVTGTSDPDLYKTVRTIASVTYPYGGGSYTPSGGFQYVFPLQPNQKATVKLHFVENQASGSGGGGWPPYGGYGGSSPRLFHVVANDGSYLEDYLLVGLNIEAEAGVGVPLVKTVTAYADADGFLTLNFINDPAVMGLDPYLVVNGQTLAATGSAPIVSAIEVTPVVDGIECGQTISNMSLDSTDESMTLPGAGGTFWADRYKLNGLNGKTVTLTATKTSGSFTPKVYLLAPEGYVLASSNSGSSLSWTLDRDGQYTVVVSSQTSATTGEYSLSLSCVDNVVNPPAAPSNLVARAVSNPRQGSIDSIELKWLDNSLDEQKFKIWRHEVLSDGNTGTWTPVGDAVASPGVNAVVVWRETSIPASEKVYEYKVEAVKGTLVTASNLAKVNTYIVPPVVSILSPTDRTQTTSSTVTIEIAASASKGKDIPEGKIYLLENGAPITSGVSVTRSATKKNRYTIVWSGVPSGDHRLSVRVEDSGYVASTTTAQWLTVGATPVHTPVISSTRAFNNGPKVVEITTDTPDTTIYYKLAAISTSNPIDFAPGQPDVLKYTGPFTLFRSARVWAKAYRGSMPASAIGDAPFSFTTSAVPNPGNNFGTIAKQPDAYFNQLPSTLSETQRSYFKTAAPGVEIFTGRAKLWGAISGPNVASWTLYYRPLEQDDRAKSFDADKGWRPLTSGVGARPLGQLGEFDTTMLSNGQYEFRLRVYNLNYDPANSEALLDPNNPDLGKNYSDTFRTALVEGGQKSGPFTLSLNDLTLPAPGFPIQIARTYDSTDKSQGDFGIGWRLAVNNVKVQASATAIAAPSSGYPYGGGTTSESGRTRALGDGWQEKYSPILQTYYLVADEPHYLTISLPTGETYGFYAMLTSETSSVPFDQLNNFELPKVHFKPIPGTVAERHQAANEYMPGARLYAVLSDGTVTDTVPVDITADGASSSQNGVRTRRLQLLESDSSGGYSWGGGVLDVKDWLLVTRAGAKFYFNTERGLTRMVDTNGNEIVYTYGELGPYINSTQRSWRIGTIRTYRNTLSGPSLTRELNITWLNGYIKQISDPANSTIVYEQNAAGDLVWVKNRTNDVVSYAYDNQHNLIQLQSPVVNQTGETGALASVQPTVYNKYDENGKLVATLDADGNATVTNHYPSERRTVITAPTGEQSLLSYDDVGNVLLTAKYAVETVGNTTVTRPITTETTYSYWKNGSNTSPNPLSKFANLPTEQKTQIGHDPVTGEIRPQDLATQAFIYDTDNFYKMGDLIKTIDALGKESTLRYDAYGRVLETRDPTRLDEGKRPNVRNVYDPLTGNLLQTKTALNATTTMEYRPDGLPSKTVDALGNPTSVEYDANGNVWKTKDALNHETEIVYGVQANGFNAGALGLKTEQRVKRLNPTTGAMETIVTKFEYDAEGRVTKTTSPDNRTSQTVYNAQGRAWKRIDSNGRESKTIYDGKGRVVKSIDPLGRTSTTSYDAAGRVVQTVSSTGTTTTQEYNALGQVVKTTTVVPNGPTTTSKSEYDDAGRVSKSFDTLNRPSGTSEYDKNGQVLVSKNAAGAVIGSYSYDDAGKSKWSKDARGAYSVPIYDAEGRVLKSYGGLTSEPQYDINGNFVVPVGAKPLGETFYDELGRAIIERDGAGRTKAFKFDAVGRLVKVVQVMNTTALPPDLNANGVNTKMQYDTLMLLGIDTDPSGAVHPHQITTYEYDELGNKTKQIDAKGRETRFIYDSLGRLVKRIMPGGQFEEMFYDANGRLDYKKDFRGRATKFKYNTDVNSPNFGKLLQKYPVAAGADPASANPAAESSDPGISYTYETSAGVNQGKRTEVNYGSVKTSFVYDPVKGQLTSVATLLNNVQMGAVAYGYHPDLGMKTSTTTYLGTSASGVNTFEYDSEDRLWKVWNAAITTAPLATYGYNENGSLKTVTRPSATSTYEYDSKNQLLSISHVSANASDLKTASRFYYQTDDSGKRVAIHDGTQTTGSGSSVQPIDSLGGGTRYTYDLAGRIATEAIPAVAGEPTKVIAYTYDKVGNRLSRTETKNPGQGNQSVLTTTYSYTRTENPASSGDVPDLARYGTGQAAIDAYKASYLTNDWLWKETRSDGTSVYYDYDANGAIKYERTFAPGGALIRLSELSFTFDGKLSQQRFWEPGTSTMVTSQTLYNYDGDGNRIGLQRQQLGTVGMSYGVVTSENHEYLVDTSQPYAEVIQERAWATDGAGTSLDGTAQIYRYDIGLDRLHYFKYQIPINGPPTLSSPVLSEWLLFDGLGSTRALVGDSGSVVDEFGYNDAFGIPYRVTANGGGRAVAGPGFFLNGQQWDGGTSWGRDYWSGSPAFNSGEGLYFNRARYYQPGLGRFIGEDPVRGSIYEPFSLHRYLYVKNSPVNHIDPSGREFSLAGQMTVGSIIGGLGGALHSYVVTGKVQLNSVLLGVALGAAMPLGGNWIAAGIQSGTALGGITGGISLSALIAAGGYGLANTISEDQKIISSNAPKPRKVAASVDIFANLIFWGLSKSAMPGLRSSKKAFEGESQYSEFEEPRYAQTGARRVISEDAAWDGSELRYYEQIRNDETDVAQISENCGLSRATILLIKYHLFFNKQHVLDEGRVGRFDADPDIVNAWFRLKQGDFVPEDMDLMYHELAEALLEKNFETLRDAHLFVENRLGWKWTGEDIP